MRRLAGREAAARAAAALYRERTDAPPSRDSRVAADEEFALNLARYIERETGAYPRLSRMRTRDYQHWCARYHSAKREAARVPGPTEMPTYGKMWRYLHEGEPW